MDIELIKEMYFKELEGKTVQDGRLPVQVGLLTVIGGVLLFALRNPVATGDRLYELFFGVVIVALLFYCFSIICVCLANIGHKYERLPRADTMYSYFLSLTDFYEKGANAQGTAEDDFNEYLRRKMVEATSRNTDVNLLRSARNHTAVVLLAWAAAFSLASGAIALSKASNDLNRELMQVDKVIVNNLSYGKEDPK